MKSKKKLKKLNKLIIKEPEIVKARHMYDEDFDYEIHEKALRENETYRRFHGEPGRCQDCGIVEAYCECRHCEEEHIDDIM